MDAMPRKRASSPPPVRARVAVLATGGTIAGAGAPSPGRGYRSAIFSIESLIAAAPGIEALARLDVAHVSSIGSQDMGEAVWRALARRTQAALANPDVDGVVITHGTDTMEETAYFLNLVVRSSKPVVLVGAMRPATAISADGPMNLYNAVATAAHPDAGGRGVLVVANDDIHFAREVAKTNTTQVGTFKSTHRGLAGLVSSGRIHFYGAPVRRHTLGSDLAVPRAGALPRVDIVYAHAGMGRELIDAAVRGGARGLVVAGVGNGNLGSSALKAAAAASRAGLAVVRSTRTGGGIVERNIEVDDDRLGFIAADELNPQKARILLMLGLLRTRDHAALQAMFYDY
jgi:L-asparaginase